MDFLQNTDAARHTSTASEFEVARAPDISCQFPPEVRMLYAGARRDHEAGRA